MEEPKLVLYLYIHSHPEFLVSSLLKETGISLEDMRLYLAELCSDGMVGCHQPPGVRPVPELIYKLSEIPLRREKFERELKRMQSPPQEKKKK